MSELIMVFTIGLLSGFIIGQATKVRMYRQMLPEKVQEEIKREESSTPKKKKEKDFFAELGPDEMSEEEKRKERDFKLGYMNILNYDGTADSQIKGD